MVLENSSSLQSLYRSSIDCQYNLHVVCDFRIGFGELVKSNNLILFQMIMQLGSPYYLKRSESQGHRFWRCSSLSCTLNQRFEPLFILLFWKNGHRKLCRNGSFFVRNQLAGVSHWFAEISHTYDPECTTTTSLSWISRCYIGSRNFLRSKLFY